MEHLAIVSKGTIIKILSGEKKIESRFTKNKIAPYNNIKKGERVYLKESGGPVTAIFTAGNIQYFDNLNAQKLLEIKTKYNSKIKADDGFWEYKKNSIYGTLIEIELPKRITPFNINKLGRQAFVSYEGDIKEKITKPRPKPRQSDCANKLHSFYSGKYIDEQGYVLCDNCKQEIINSNNLGVGSDFSKVYKELKKEKWRYDWFNVELDDKARNLLLRWEGDKLRQKILKRLEEAILYYNEEIDETQTPYSGNPIYYAQHTTACCCRGCLDKWHGIPRKRKLNDSELNYILNLIESYLQIKRKEIIKNK